MFTRDDVPHEQRLPSTITVTVDSVRVNPKPRREAELTVRDLDGKALEVVIWETHEIGQSWVVGARYEITGARGKRYPKQNDTNVELHSTKDFSARRVITNETTRALVLGDTHIGYRHRPPSAKPAWAKEVNGCEVFVQCLEQARELAVDAVIHTGDVFDHKNTQEDRDAVVQAIERTVDAGIPFYYVFGNHDDPKGRELLASTSGTHLAATVSPVVEPPLRLFGVDHSGKSFPQTAPHVQTGGSPGQNVLVIHESPHPVVDATESLLYQQDGNRADLSGYINTAAFDIDLIVTGHLHVATQTRVQEYDIPVLVSGPTIPISTYESDSNPSTWLLTATSSGINLERLPV